MANFVRYLNISTRKYVAVFALIFVAGLDNVGAVETKGRLIHFRVFSASVIEDLEFSVDSDPKRARLEFYPTAKSPRYSVVGQGLITFSFVGDEKATIQAQIPNGINEALLLFSVSAVKGGLSRLSVEVFDDGTVRQPLGTWVVLNASGLPLSGTLGSARITLASGLNPPKQLSHAIKLELRTPFRGRSFRPLPKPWDEIERAGMAATSTAIAPGFARSSVALARRFGTTRRWIRSAQQNYGDSRKRA